MYFQVKKIPQLALWARTNDGAATSQAAVGSLPRGGARQPPGSDGTNTPAGRSSKKLTSASAACAATLGASAPRTDGWPWGQGQAGRRGQLWHHLVWGQSRTPCQEGPWEPPVRTPIVLARQSPLVVRQAAQQRRHPVRHVAAAERGGEVGGKLGDALDGGVPGNGRDGVSTPTGPGKFMVE